MLSDNGRFLESEKKLLEAGLSPIRFFKLMGMVNSIPNDWTLIVCKVSNPFVIESAAVDVLKVTSNMLYNEFKRQRTNGAFCSKQNKTKISRSFSGVERNLLSSVYRDTKTREFQYKLLNNIFFSPMRNYSDLK